MQDISDELASLAALRTCAARPQKLQIRNRELFFLEGTKQTLCSVALSSSAGTTGAVVTVGQPEPVIVCSGVAEDGASGSAKRTLTREEELLRERMRVSTEGISWYTVLDENDADGQIVPNAAIYFISSMTLFAYFRHGPHAGRVWRVFDYLAAATPVSQHIVEGLRSGSVVAQTIQLCAPAASAPRTHERKPPIFHFVSDFNVYEVRLVPTAAIGDDSACRPPFTAELVALTTSGLHRMEFGTADYIMQEEFDRYSGFTARGDYVIALHTDTTMLRRVSLEGDESFDFPRVGDANAQSTVLVIHRGGTEGIRCIPHGVLVDAMRSVAVGVSSHAMVEPEYITRFGFLSDTSLFVEVLNREQDFKAIVAFKIGDIPLVSSEADIPRSAPFHRSPNPCAPAVLWSQHLPWGWCEVTNCLHLDEHGSEPLQILGAHVEKSLPAGSSDDGYFHLWGRLGTDDAAFVRLTFGRFNVKPNSVRRIESKDGSRGVLFECNALHRLGNSIFYLPLMNRDSPNSQVAPRLVTRLPHDEFVHSYTVCTEIGAIAYVASTSNALAQIRVVPFSSSCNLSTALEDAARAPPTEASDMMDRALPPVEWQLPKQFQLLSQLIQGQVFTFTSPRGVPLSGLLFLPPSVASHSAHQSVPLMMYVYGGPHVQLVTINNLDVNCVPVIQSLVRRGVAVVIVDNQMSNANSLVDHSICKKRMGQFEVEDYVSFKSQLVEDVRVLDPNRVGIFGWSYGGYVTLLAMSQAASHFKLGFAGAPVGDWRLYDTGYTERYMGLLSDPEAAIGYERGAVPHFVDGFPDDINRLFVAHGLLDENVHFTHTSLVITALVEHMKPHQVLVYPGERHGLRQKRSSRLHYDAQLVATVCKLL